MNMNNFGVIDITIQFSTLYNCQVIILLWSKLPAVIDRSCRPRRRITME